MSQNKYQAVADGRFIRLRIERKVRGFSGNHYVLGFVTYIRDAGEMPITEEVTLQLPLNIERRTS